jgi:hypothetical protein
MTKSLAADEVERKPALDGIAILFLFVGVSLISEISLIKI